jgi:hypothetical protein
MKISTSSIATLAIALTAVGGAALGISRVSSVENQVNVPASSTVVDKTTDLSNDTVTDIPAGKIAAVISPSATPTPVAPTPAPTPTTTPTDPTQDTTPVAPLNPVFGSGGDDDESDDSYGDGESDDDYNYSDGDNGSDDDYGHDDSGYEDDSDD